jgi:biopolymer transport protein ExbD
MSKKKKPSPPIEINLPITPMLDMSFQLLSFFILTFKPMAQEGQLSMMLPKPDNADKPSESIETLPDEKKAEYKIITYSANGKLAYMSISSESRTAEGQLSLESLNEELKVIPNPSKVNITIECDQDLLYSNLISIMNVCKLRGFESVGIAPKGKS